MKILITGATGYVGRRVVKQLITQLVDVEIMTLNRNVEKAINLMPYEECKHVDITNLDEAVKQFMPEICLHLATLSTSRNDKDIIEPIIDTNIVFGVKLLNAIKEVGSLKLFINTGSFAEYREGIECGFKDAYLYTATKSAFRHFVEYYATLSGYKCITVVPFTIYGGDDTAKKLMDYMMESIDAIEPVKMSPGEQVLDFIHVDDVVQFYVNAVKCVEDIKNMSQGETYFVGTGVGTRVRDLANEIEELLHRKLNIEWGGLNYRPLDVMRAIAPIEKNNKIINWDAKISLRQGIEQLIRKYEKN